MILFQNVMHSEDSNVKFDVYVSLIDLTHPHDKSFSD